MKAKKDLFSKALLMAALAGAILGVAQAGYDADGTGDDRHAGHAASLIRTLSEEQTEINTLAAQQARFRQMGDAESNRIARLFGMMIRDHKAGGPALMKAIRDHGGDPNDARILKAPVLGSKDEMMHATHKDHEAAIMTSQMRYMIAKRDGDANMMRLMRKRANVARKHIRWMRPYHDM